ncbi:ATP-binding cassette domain-containing protein [Leptospira licerasiae]|uniref:Hemin ABC transporter, ATP-binding protein HmuV family protein n=1 Tax=Leptospira licerasiae str. MMD4847 TaxID=1049971 RepID=A0ABN0H4J0_9LEPT|nr:ATP-binding cassette domain-containing protein [Leptospira licerasiae]EIE02682.1 putative hemin import ATP-binding protein HmuV [Leptospira licerasiae serovar Varillal str. VAR 010]EJZ40479.1 hemin ABC transporter, ATP-binding protein HmuV family protein [Leptospira licerasiae str. MMD4847]
MSLVLSDISLSRGGRFLLSGVNLSLYPGELLIVLGPNGAGKSTLLKLFSGEISPDKGLVLLDGIPLSEYDSEDLALRRSVLSQESEIHFPFIADEIVRMGRSCSKLRVPKPLEDRITEDAFCAVHLGERERFQTYNKLSGGEKQRTQMARVLVQDKEPTQRESYVLLDEPGASLDPNRIHSLLEKAKQLSKEGRGVLCILHDLNLALRYADRIAVLKEGKILADGIPEHILNEVFVLEHFRLRTKKIPFPEGGYYLIPLGPAEPNTTTALPYTIDAKGVKENVHR